MTDKKEKQSNYILKTVGITLPGYKRKDLKVGKCVVLDESVGDRYANKGFLVKGDKAVSDKNNIIADLKKENSDLKTELAALKKEKELKNGKK